jgi:hypothetical protein
MLISLRKLHSHFYIERSQSNFMRGDNTRTSFRCLNFVGVLSTMIYSNDGDNNIGKTNGAPTRTLYQSQAHRRRGVSVLRGVCVVEFCLFLLPVSLAGAALVATTRSVFCSPLHSTFAEWSTTFARLGYTCYPSAMSNCRDDSIRSCPLKSSTSDHQLLVLVYTGEFFDGDEKGLFSLSFVVWSIVCIQCLLFHINQTWLKITLIIYKNKSQAQEGHFPHQHRHLTMVLLDIRYGYWESH